jgi:hypothetical protein
MKPKCQAGKFANAGRGVGRGSSDRGGIHRRNSLISHVVMCKKWHIMRKIFRIKKLRFVNKPTVQVVEFLDVVTIFQLISRFFDPFLSCKRLVSRRLRQNRGLIKSRASKWEEREIRIERRPKLQIFRPYGAAACGDVCGAITERGCAGPDIGVPSIKIRSKIMIERRLQFSLETDGWLGDDGFLTRERAALSC